MITKIKTGVSCKKFLAHVFPWQSWPGNEPLIENGRTHCGRSYNCLYLSNRTSDQQSLFFGIFPKKEINASQIIEFWPEKNGELTVILKGDKSIFVKNLSLAESLAIYKKHLPKPEGITLLDNWRIGFSWPSAGPFEVDQNFVLNELEAAAKMPVGRKPFVQAYIIDHGWFNILGDNNFNPKKFPKPEEITSRARRLKIVPGIWVAPFLVSPCSGLAKSHPDWFVRKDGRLVKDPLWFSPRLTGLPILERVIILDISVEEVRKHVVNSLKKLYDQGFRLFKLDFLYAALMGELKNKSKSPVAYYRGLLSEIRKTLGNDALLLGCGAPLMESVGLVNGIRITNDSAMGSLSGMPLLRKLPGLVKNPVIRFINGRMYREAMDQAERNALLWHGIHGLVLDGIHFLDNGIPLSAKTKYKVGVTLLSVWALGCRNITVGDSLDSIYKSKKAREIWETLWNVLYKPNSDRSSKWPAKLAEGLGIFPEKFGRIG